ncbi:MAG: Ig-like domain-containing protein, partial [Dolichospermum sp.]
SVSGKTPSQIACCEFFTIVLMNDDTIYGTGNNEYGQLGTVSNFLTKMINNTGKTPSQIVHGTYFTIVLMSDGTIYGTGNNVGGQLGTGDITHRTTLTQMINTTGKTPSQIACGTSFTIVLMSDGTIYGTGNNGSGQLGTNNNTSRTTLTQMNSVSGKTPSQIACGASFTMVLMNDGTIYGTGNNGSGQLGTSNLISRTTLTQMTSVSGKTPSQIACGNSFTIVLMSDGTIYGTGDNANGQLGTNNNTSRSSLIQMNSVSGKTPSQIACGASFTIVLMIGGTIYGTGNNGSGQLGTGDATDRTILTQSSFSKNVYATNLIKLMNNMNNFAKNDALITNFSIPTKTYGDAPFTIIAPTSNSSGTFSYTSSNTSVATISGNTITIVGAGSSDITATQSETQDYTSGTIISTFQVNQLTPTITNFSIPTKTYGDAPFTI